MIAYQVGKLLAEIETVMKRGPSGRGRSDYQIKKTVQLDNADKRIKQIVQFCQSMPEAQSGDVRVWATRVVSDLGIARMMSQDVFYALCLLRATDAAGKLTGVSTQVAPALDLLALVERGMMTAEEPFTPALEVWAKRLNDTALQCHIDPTAYLTPLAVEVVPEMVVEESVAAMPSSPVIDVDFEQELQKVVTSSSRVAVDAEIIKRKFEALVAGDMLEDVDALAQQLAKLAERVDLVGALLTEVQQSRIYDDVLDAYDHATSALASAREIYRQCFKRPGLSS